jgi:hypothetical protein
MATLFVLCVARIGFLNAISVNFSIHNSYQKGKTGFGGVDWIDPAQDRDQWQALVNTVMNFRVP